jgi:predicted nucleic acid-binding protein
MTAPVFVDTNVLIYSFDTRDPKKPQAANRWRRPPISQELPRGLSQRDTRKPPRTRL